MALFVVLDMAVKYFRLWLGLEDILLALFRLVKYSHGCGGKANTPPIGHLWAPGGVSGAGALLPLGMGQNASEGI